MAPEEVSRESSGPPASSEPGYRPRAKIGGRERVFRNLGRWIVAHPYYPITIWVILLIVAIPAVSVVGNVTTNSATTLPNNAPSIEAQNELARLFPSQAPAVTSLIVIQGNDVTGPVGQAAVIELQDRIQNDSSLEKFQSVSTLYSSYSQYLQGQAQLALGILRAAYAGPDSLHSALNGTANLTWSPPAIYTGLWLQAAASSPPGTNINWTVYEESQAELETIQNSSVRELELGLLRAYYTAFNASSPCAAEAASSTDFVECSTAVARVALGPVLNATPSIPTDISTPVLSQLGIANYSQAAPVSNLTLRLLAPASGLPLPWLMQVSLWFPGFEATPSTIGDRMNATVAGTAVARYPLPIPASIYTGFVDPSNNLTLVVLTYTVDDSYVGPGGSTPVFDDIGKIGNILPSVLPRGYSYWQSGEAALDLDENNVLSSDLVYTLPLSIAALLIITGLYFRSPVTPAVAFGPIGLALVIGLAGTYAVGTLVEKVDVTTLTLQEAFVLGVGTDYSVFLFSRYREEIRKGATNQEAVVTTVTWAGESITISGGTVILSTIALTFSGVTLLSQWGMILSLSVAIALLVALTVVPALLTLLGPRVFWPGGKRLQKKAADPEEPAHGYFTTASRFAVRRALVVVGVAALISVPIAYVAITAPVTFDFYSQLPSSQPSSQGLQAIANHFGPGYAFPIQILVTFSQPLLVGNQTNALEFAQIADLTGYMNETHGVASVDSPTGATGVPLSEWLEYSSAPPAVQADLQGTLDSYLGNDGKTVLFTVVPSSSGLSGNAIDSLNAIQGNLTAYAGAHSTVSSVAYGGAASELRDLNDETTAALDRMITIVVIGLLLVLLLLLASLAIPVLAVATILMSIGWAWATTYLVMTGLFGIPIFFFDRVVLFVIVLGLGMDYNIFILTRIREERSHLGSTREAIIEAVGRTGGVVTAAALILASVFFVLATSSFALLATIGFSLGIAVVLDAMLVRTYVMPSLLALLKEKVWWVPGRKESSTSERGSR